MTNPLNVLGEALYETLLTVMSFLPNLIVAIVIFGIGLICGSVLGKMVAHFINIIKLDKVLGKAGVDNLSAQAGVKITVAGFLGALVKWIIIVAFAVAASETLGLTQFGSILKSMLSYVPAVIVAVLILVVSIIVGDAVGKAVSHSLKASQVKAPKMGSITKWSIITIGGILPALAQLNIGAGIIQIILIGLVSAFALAFGLAFGLGGKSVAEEILREIKNRE